MGGWSKELALRGKRTRRRARGDDHEPVAQSAKLNKADPWAYLKDVLTRLPTQLNSRIDELLPHRWKPAT